MRAVVVYLIDDAVAEDSYEGSRIDIKIHKDGRGHIAVDNRVYLYRRAERITLFRDQNPAMNELEPRARHEPPWEGPDAAATA